MGYWEVRELAERVRLAWVGVKWEGTAHSRWRGGGVEGLNDGLLKVVALHQSYAKAPSEQRGKILTDIKAIHEKCLAWL